MEKPTTVVEVLDIIDEFIISNSNQGELLYSILTALRGPDISTNELKQNTTAIIRANAFPKTERGGAYTLGDVNLDVSLSEIEDWLEQYNLPPANAFFYAQHFKAHIICAVQVLIKIRGPE